jgi:hypothetical protein
MTADGPQASPTPEKNWYQQWWVWAIVVVGVLVIIGLVVSGSNGGDESAAGTTVVEETTAPPEITTTTAPEETTTTTEPAETTTTTPEETTTTAPAETTTTLPTVLAAGEGRGNAIVELDIPQVPAVVDLSHDGPGSFIVMSLDPSLEHIVHLALTTGPHEGTAGIQLTKDEIVSGLEIEADGNWTYEIRPVAGEPRVACPVHGQGEDVVILSSFEDQAGQADVTYDGENPFSISAYGDGVSDLIVNVVGPYAGTVDVAAGLFVWVVDDMFDNASWSIDC